MKKLTIPTFIILFITIAILNIDRNNFANHYFDNSSSIELSNEIEAENQFVLLAEDNKDKSTAIDVNEKSLLLYSIDIFQLVLKQ